MLHILLLVLKIIGIIIAVILGILVLLILIILLVPVRYQGETAADGTWKGISAKIKVHWFFHLIAFSAEYKDEAFFWRFRIAWKKMGTDSGDGQEPAVEEKTEIRQEPAVEEKTEVRQEPAVEEQAEYKEKEEVSADEAGTEDRLEKEEKTDTKTEENVERLLQKPEKNEEESQIPPADEETPFLFEKIAGRLRAFFQKIKYTFQRLCGKIKTLSEKKEKVKEFLTDEVHRRAFQKTKTELSRLMRRIRPKKLKGTVRYGFEDPYHTGQVLAALGVVYPWLGEAVSVYPDFEKRILQGDLYVKGTVRALYVVLLIWKLVWCKDVRTTYHHIRSFE